MGSPYWPYISIILLICCSAFFSGSEISYASVNRRRLKKSAETGNLSARVGYYIAENYSQALATILIGNNLVNIAASSVAAVIAISLIGEAGTAYSSIIMAVLILIFGEIMPKIVAKEHADSFARAVALPLRLLMWITKPVVVVVDWIVGRLSRLWADDSGSAPSVTEEELVSIIDTSEDEGVIDEDRSELLHSAIEFYDICAQEILTPRVDMLAIDIDDDFDEILELAYSSLYSRIPVYEDSIDNIIGILPLNHFFKKLTEAERFDIRGMLMDVCFIHKSMKLPAVLAELKRRKTHLAVVTDEYGGTMGILTMEDVLEELVGDIWDETDEVYDEFTEIEPDVYEVSGDLSIYEMLEGVGLDPDDFEGDYTTVGGWAIDMLKGYPQVGDTFEYKGFTVTVTEMDDLRVTTVVIQMTDDNNK